MTQPTPVIINDLADLYRLLDQSPQWEEAIRNRLLGARLLSVPDRLDQQTQELRELREITGNLAETAAEHTRQLAEHTRQCVELRETTAEHTRLFVELRETAAEHTRQLTELTDQVKELRETAADNTRQCVELRETAAEHTRQLVEHTRQLTELTDQIKELRETAADNTRQCIEVRRAAERNAEAIRESNAKFSRLDQSRGILYEWKVNRHIGALLGERLDLIDLVNYHESGGAIAKELNDTIKAAARAGTITPSQMHRLAAADLLCRAVNFATDAPTVIVGEVALNLDQGDLERVVERAATMAACAMDPVQGILVGASCRPGLAERAAAAGVALFIYPE